MVLPLTFAEILYHLEPLELVVVLVIVTAVSFFRVATTLPLVDAVERTFKLEAVTLPVEAAVLLNCWIVNKQTTIIHMKNAISHM